MKGRCSGIKLLRVSSAGHGWHFQNKRHGMTFSGPSSIPRPIMASHVHLPVQKLALGFPLQRSSRKRAATYLYEKTIRIRGDNRAQENPPILTFSNISSCESFRNRQLVGASYVPCACPFIPQPTDSLGSLYMFTLASAAESRLFDSRVRDEKT